MSAAFGGALIADTREYLNANVSNATAASMIRSRVSTGVSMEDVSTAATLLFTGNKTKLFRVV